MCRTSKDMTEEIEREDIKQNEGRINMNKLKEIIDFMENCGVFHTVIIDGKKVYDIE